MLHSLPYSENSLVVKLFCRELGLRGYLVSRKAAAWYQSLNLLEAVVYESKASGLHRIAEAKFEHCYRYVGILPEKMPACYFLRELLYKTLKEESPNTELFDYVAAELIHFDTTPEPMPDFHLQFVLGYLQHMGIGVMEEDWAEILQAENDPLLRAYLLSLMQEKPIAVNRTIRNRVLDLLMAFMAQHFNTLENMKSTEILREMAQSLTK